MFIRKAEKQKAKLRLGIAGVSGSGKTYSALLIASGIGKKIGFIDTENGSGDLYADLYDYDIITLTAPFEVKKYINAIKLFEKEGYDVIIIDSLTHAWAGQGGLLEKQGKLESSGKYKNSYATWREITPEHNDLVETILQSSCHIITTMRSKAEYSLEKNENGKVAPKKIGLAPVMREGIEYEFTVMFDIEQNHIAFASKDRTSLFDGKAFVPSKETGETLLEWLNSGKEPVDILSIVKKKIEDCQTMEEFIQVRETHVNPIYQSLTQAEKADLAETGKAKKEALETVEVKDVESVS